MTRAKKLAALLTSAVLLLTLFSVALVPVTADSFSATIAVDFDSKPYGALTHTSSAGSSTLVGCVTHTGGKALAWDRGSSGDYSNFEMDFTNTGVADETAFTIWVDATNIAANMDFSLMLYDKSGVENGNVRCFRIAPGTSFTTVSVAGDVATVAANGRDALPLSKGFQGWYIVPFSAFEHVWGGAEGDTIAAGDVFRVRFSHAWHHNNVIFLDDLGFTSDAAAFAADAASKVTSMTIAHTWEGNVCAGCENNLFTVAQDFEDSVYPVGSTVSPANNHEIVADVSPFGNALKINRDTEPIVLNDIAFDAVGGVEHEAIAFWFDATGVGSQFELELIPRDIYDSLTTIGKGHPYKMVVDGQVLDVTAYGHKELSFTQGTKGWVIIPLNEKKYSSHWRLEGSGPYTGTVQNHDSVDIRIPYYNNISFVVDQFGFVADMDAFVALAASGDENLPGFGGPECPHEYMYPCDAHCMLCGELTNPEAAHTIAHVEAVEATCEAMGNVEYWTCSDCNVCWLDEALTQQTNRMNVTAFVDHEYFYACDTHCMNCGELTNPDAAHTITHVEAVEATCQATGNVEYWTCSDCNVCWRDEALMMQTNFRSIVT
ncbi:MAG: hypothetical protein IJ518_00450, partial [Clostridia bacterium]|nr:hypothetical protein [Clostridia bacterium]